MYDTNWSKHELAMRNLLGALKSSDIFLELYKVMCMCRAVPMSRKDLRGPVSHLWLIVSPCTSQKWRLRQSHKPPKHWRCAPTHTLSKGWKTYWFKTFIFIYLFTYLLIYLFIEIGEGREKEKERKIGVWVPLTWPPLGPWPATQACALTGNWTRDPLVHSPRSVHWATPARAKTFNYISDKLLAGR